MSSSRIVATFLLVVIALSALAGLAAGQESQPAAPDAPLSAAFTYQGSLRSGDAPADGPFDFQFILYDAETGGSRVGPVLPLEDVAASNGIFTVQLDFGATSFDGQARWLEVGVRPGASTGAYSILSPRHPLTAVPYALYATKAPWSGLQAIPASFADGVDDNTTYTAGTGLTLVGTTFSANTDVVQSRVTGTCAAGSAIRVVNVNGTVACEADDSGWLLTGNAGTTAGTNFLGTTDNQALELKVNGQRALRLEPVGIPPQNVNVIGGYAANEVAVSFYGATIAGGGDVGSTCGGTHNLPCWNRALAGYTAIGGGLANTASGGISTVAGGQWNTASGGEAAVGGGYGNSAIGDYTTVTGGFGNTAGGPSWTGDYATVGGGHGNTASGEEATIAGGYQNQAGGPRATVGGGYQNQAGANASTVPGGANNSAGGAYSFAAGAAANASHVGAFVWSSGAATDSWGERTFTVRSHGGARFYTAEGTSYGPTLSPGSNSWGAGSDRNTKENFGSVDAAHLLEVLAGLPLQTWNSRAQPAQMRHIGPVAQEFNGRFGYLFGEVESPLHINMMDEVGVSLAAAQGLYLLSQEQAAQIAALEVENRSLRAENVAQQAQLDDLEARLAALEARVAETEAAP